jgi:hypothetical protein
MSGKGHEISYFVELGIDGRIILREKNGWSIFNWLIIGAK